MLHTFAWVLPLGHGGASLNRIAPGALLANMLDYIFRLDKSLLSLPRFAGRVYRGIDVALWQSLKIIRNTKNWGIEHDSKCYKIGRPLTVWTNEVSLEQIRSLAFYVARSTCMFFEWVIVFLLVGTSNFFQLSVKRCFVLTGSLFNIINQFGNMSGHRMRIDWFICCRVSRQ